MSLIQKKLAPNNPHMQNILIKVRMHLQSLHMAEEFRQHYNKYGTGDMKYYRDMKAQGEGDLAGGIDQGKAAFHGRTNETRVVREKMEKMDRQVGSAFFDTFKIAQGAVATLGNTLLNATNPAVEAVNAGLRGLADTLDLFDKGKPSGARDLPAPRPPGPRDDAEEKQHPRHHRLPGTHGGDGSNEGDGPGDLGTQSGIVPDYEVSGGPSLAQKYVLTANKYVGRRYLSGGGHENKAHGVEDVDCSGLIAQLGLNLGKPELDGLADRQAYKGVPVAMNDLKPGDRLYHLQRYVKGADNQGAGEHHDKQGYSLGADGKRFAGHTGQFIGKIPGRPGDNWEIDASSSKGRVVQRRMFNNADGTSFWHFARTSFDTHRGTNPVPYRLPAPAPPHQVPHPIKPPVLPAVHGAKTVIHHTPVHITIQGPTTAAHATALRKAAKHGVSDAHAQTHAATARP
jgi:cell wall-associated NlpC family hydrolase